jgi:predicted flap endonuclease-1-like 5' DNA nuclease
MMIFNQGKVPDSMYQLTQVDWVIWGLIILASIVLIFLLIRRAGINKTKDTIQPLNQESESWDPIGPDVSQTAEFEETAFKREPEPILQPNPGKPLPDPVIPKQQEFPQLVPVSEPAVDDLKRIRGITPGALSILNAAGIRTFRQLAETDPVRLELILRRAGMRLPNTSSWPDLARLAETGDWESLEHFQKQAAGRV